MDDLDEKAVERVARALCRSKQRWGDTIAVTEQYVDTCWRDYAGDAAIAIMAYLAARPVSAGEAEANPAPAAIKGVP